MALPRITQKEMTEREQRELKTLLDRARIAHGRVLTKLMVLKLLLKVSA